MDSREGLGEPLDQRSSGQPVLSVTYMRMTTGFADRPIKTEGEMSDGAEKGTEGNGNVTGSHR